MFYLRRIIYLFKVIVGIDLFGRNRINLKNKSKGYRFFLYPFWYLLQLICAVLNLILVGELLFLLVVLTHKYKRRLTQKELLVLDSKYVSINWKRILIIENSWLADMGRRYAKSMKMGVCITHSLLFSCELDHEQNDRWLLHEAAHYIQYKQRGIIYIFEALIAQQFSGYNYELENWREYSLKAFNPEQQAEILSREEKRDRIVV